MADDQHLTGTTAPVRSDYTVKKGEVSLAVYRKRLAPAAGEPARPVLFLVHGSSNWGCPRSTWRCPVPASTRR